MKHLQQHGDNASGLILAHEWAHHIQTLIGVDAQLAKGQITLRAYELQADCFAGAYQKHAAAQGLLEPGDAEDARTMVHAIGDDALNQPTGPSVHGTSQQRVLWFLSGSLTGNPSVCTPSNSGY
jgi:predicted metalloprotease